jgi:hypothetical protein
MSTSEPDRTSARASFTRAEIIQAATSAANIVSNQTLELFPGGTMTMPEERVLRAFTEATEAVTISILRAAYAVEKRANGGAR